ncbi:beta-N-acetylhexosaminidase [Mobilisporobacter senegalensis]|uniref:beta-N-acetylhexosaminidase n=2 Tax=Mobilisporobacter senegalensis TaxID=1329262 RepID=A0A3N1XL16_9FIRM|nr:beta-N-acetylhexosaminidase [Mobilisporobacter senegalensis]
MDYYIIDMQIIILHNLVIENICKEEEMKMRKIIYIFMILLMSVLLMSCKDKGKNIPEDPKTEENKDLNENKNETVEEQPDESKEDIEEVPDNEGGNVIGTNDSAIITGLAGDIMKNMTLEEKVGQLFIVNLELLDSSKGNYYEFRSLTKKMVAGIQKYNVGGVCFFSRNIETREQTTKLINKLQERSKFPMFITVDEEGGQVARIANNDNMKTTKFPTIEEIGKMDDKEYAFNMGETIGREIRELGFNVDFAPVADVRTNELNTEIGNRSFGNNPKLVARMVKEVVSGLQSQGISATLKHFPGHGDAVNDSHEGAVNVENDIERLRSVEFVPFKAGIKEGADFVMISHISISRVTEDTVPASLSSLVLNEMLRLEMGFQGIAITDALNMKAITDQYNSKQAAKQAFIAGADILLMPEKLPEAYNSILQAVQNGEISEERLDTSVRRILEIKVKRGIIPIDTDLVAGKMDTDNSVDSETEENNE